MQSGHRRAEFDDSAGPLGGVDQQCIDHGAPRRIQRVHPAERFDRHGDRFVAVVEDGPTHRRRALRDQPAQQTPPLQLQDPPAHQHMGGPRVAAVPRAVDAQHPKPPAGQQQRRRGAGHSCPDDDGIPVPIHDPSPLWSGPGVDPLGCRVRRRPLAFPDPAWAPGVPGSGVGSWRSRVRRGPVEQSVSGGRVRPPMAW